MFGLEFLLKALLYHKAAFEHEFDGCQLHVFHFGLDVSLEDSGVGDVLFVSVIVVQDGLLLLHRKVEVGEHRSIEHQSFVLASLSTDVEAELLLMVSKWG